MNTIVRKMPLRLYGDKEATMCMVELDIDIERFISKLAHRAFYNKTKQTRAVHGGIVVNVRPCSQEAP